MTNSILTGDALTVLRTLPDGIAHCVVTSPPYWALRSYTPKDSPLKSLELGSEKSPDCLGWATGKPCGECWICHMVAVFREVRRVLRDDGTLWVNCGDKAASAKGKCRNPGGGVGSLQKRTKLEGQHPLERPNVTELREMGVEQLSIMGMPWRLGLAMQADGWVLRMDNIWFKRAPMPESVAGTRWVRHRVKVCDGLRTTTQWNQRTGAIHSEPKWADCPGCEKCSPHGGLVLRRGNWRCTRAHEYVLQFQKGQFAFADQEGVKVRQSAETMRRFAPGQAAFKPGDKGEGAEPGRDRANADAKNRMPGRIMPDASANPRSVWRLKGGGSKLRHYAMFPISLPDFCIRASTSPKGVCPKCGSQWARVLRSNFVPSQSTNNECKLTDNQDNNRNPAETPRGTVESTTLGWKATCECAAGEPVPALVLDPFAGAGTTLLAAQRLGRDYLGIELNPVYVEIAQKRLRGDAPLFGSAT